MTDNDDEQVEKLQKWLQTHGSSIITGVIIGLVIILGVQFWQRYHASQAENASLVYNALQRAVQSQDKDAIATQANLLLDDYSSSAYAALAQLLLAKVAVDNDDMDEALRQLQAVVDSEHSDFQTIARLRLARLLIGANRLDQAQEHLDQISDFSFTAEQEELRGDLYAARDEPEKARNAYKAALAARGDSADTSFLEMKLDSLPASTEEPS